MDIEAKWNAVLARDASKDGVFVYAVRSTHIYCRPVCPSKRPRRDQVQFFEQPADAEQAGFRPCRRCRPDAPPQNTQEELAAAVREYIDTQHGAAVSLESLAAHTGSSPFHLQRVFKRVMGVTPRQYAEAKRLALVKVKLKEHTDVTTAMYDAGYGSSSRLYERASKELGMTPATYAKGGRGAQIRFATTQSPLGRILVAATVRGVCAVTLGDSDAELQQALYDQYPLAEIREDAAGMQAHVDSVLALLGGEPAASLPLDVRATAFEWRVWQELSQLRRGETRSYSELAKAIGQPSATRAVANACGANPVALVIPCHRAVRQDGTLGGYRWGLDRKKTLLARERG
jgi:AraC family transcriptional regulator of adaptative response/methylated-DNA-[protein]-cysteine methyltransferase